MTKIDIFSGFLGAGKTTLIKKLIKEAYAGEKLVLIENEFGEIGIDGGFLAEAGIQISEMNSGCICCSLVGDFGKALKKVLAEYRPDRILIEPSGVGKLSDVIAAVRGAVEHEVELNCFTTVADASKCKMYMKNFGEFYNDQIAAANTIVLSRTDGMDEAKLQKCVELLRTQNTHAAIITTPWDQLTGAQILETMQQKNTLEQELEELARRHEEEHEHHHHHHDHDHCCDHEHEHHHDHEHCCDHEHHHHDHDHCCGHDHEHHHDHDHDHEQCSCGCHHHGHDADEMFTSWGVESPKKFTEEEIRSVLTVFSEGDSCGMILRAKGIVPATDGSWIHFDYVPGEVDLRRGAAGVTGRLCVIGAKIDEKKIAELFGV
ncbi:MAG: GTP-binding protein [Oscillospiraceae bacterium]|nr:GTP-binding protein [Oscillospiraceae bacterium]